MNDQFFRTVADMGEEQEAVLERQMDPDLALVSDYVVGELSDEDAARVRQRIQDEPDFRDLAEPLLLAWEHRSSPPRFAEDELDRRFMKLCRRVGAAPVAAAPDVVMGDFRREIVAARRRSRRNRVLMVAAIVVLAVLPPAIVRIASETRGGLNIERAEPGKTLVVDLGGGSSATLSGGAQINKTIGFGIANRVLYLTGEARFVVAPGERLPLVVRTEYAEVTVSGTRFRIEAWASQDNEISVEEGTVHVRARDKSGRVYGPSIPIRRGQRIFMYPGHIPEDP